MVKKQEKDDVDYLVKTAFDSDSWIFRNLSGSFQSKSTISSPKSQMVKMNGKNPFL